MRLLSCFLALALSSSAALAGDVAPLAPGAPAGVKRAQAENDNNIVLYAALGVGIVAGFVVALTSGSNSGPAPSGPSSTSIASTA